MPGHTTKEKAKKIKREGKIRGKKLTKKQEGFFGLIAGGRIPDKQNIAERMTS